jgi:hypothetical protein
MLELVRSKLFCGGLIFPSMAVACPTVEHLNGAPLGQALAEY